MPPDNDVQREIELLEQRFAENSQGLVFAHLADAYRRAGEFAKAEGLILHGLKNHPNYTSAYNVLGRVYLDSERYEEAQQQFSKVLDLDPHNLAALRALADLAERDGRLADARAWYERMLQIDPRSEEARAGLAALQPDIEGHPEMLTGQAAERVGPEPAGEAEPSAGFGFEAEVEAFPIEVEAAEGEAGEGERGAGDAAGGWPFEHDLDAEIDDAFAAAAAGDVRDDWEEETRPEPAPQPEAEGEPISEPAAAESMEIDFGIMDDWTPALLDRDAEQAKAEPAAADAGSFFEELEDSFTLDLGGEAEEEAAGFEPQTPEASGEAMVTETMARLYADQGLYEDALRVYRQLAEVRPDDEGLAAQIQELEDRLGQRLPDREGEAEEVAELLMMTEAGRPVGDADAPGASLTDVRGDDEDGFHFEDEAPVAGLEHLDPFAASFDVFALKEAPAAPLAGEPVAEEPPAEEPVEEVLEVAGEEITPEPVPEPTAVETTPEPWVAPVGAESADLADIEEVVPITVEPEPFAEEALEEGEVEPEAPVPQVVDTTIEEYLASLLEVEPGTPEVEASEPPSTEAPGGAEGAGSDDIEKFQEWLRSLKR